jgi:uncharacterized Zn finger protein
VFLEIFCRERFFGHLLLIKLCTSRLKQASIICRKISAKSRGKKNPYFGVYKEPTYKTSISITPISPNKWAGLIQAISTSASTLSRLLINEMPDNEIA